VGWIDDAKGRAQVAQVAQALGLEIKGRTLQPCPACGAEKRGSADRRGPVNVHSAGQRWTCKRGGCGAGGDVVDLVAVCLFGRRLGDCDDDGKAEVRAWLAAGGACDPAPDGRAPRVTPPPLPPPPTDDDAPPARDYQSIGEVHNLWNDCGPVTDDDQTAGWLRSRGLDPDRVEESDLARALPDGKTPGWSRCAGRPWSAGWRCILPAFDAGGEIRAFRARWCRTGDPPKGTPKAAATPGRADGLVLADGLARQVLAEGAAPRWWPAGEPLRLVVLEGEPDWLTWATRPAAGEATAPALVGIWQGSWTAEIAARIPRGAKVAIRTHLDDDGNKYGERIAATLAGRCDVRRLRAEGSRR
jgi:hypothetical protein